MFLGVLKSPWRDNPEQGANDQSLKLFDLINELLRGVVGSKHGDGEELCKQVSDLYVFLLKHLLLAEQSSDVKSIEEIRAVLQVEAETWRSVCANELPAAPAHSGSGTSSGLNLEA